MKTRYAAILLILVFGFFGKFFLSILGIDGKAFAGGESVRSACLDFVRQRGPTNEKLHSERESDLQIFRNHIFRAREKAYQAEFPDRIGSFFGGNEHDMIVPVSVPDSHAFYFDSGADVFRLMLDFPGAENYHLLLAVDSGQDMDQRLVQSIKMRLETMATSIEVERNGSWERLFGFHASNPLILKVVFDFSSESLGQTKRVWIHPFDPNRRPLLNDLFDDDSFRGPWVGFIGNGLINMNPRDKTRGLTNRILERLSPDGWYIGVEDVRAFGVELSKGLLTTDSEREVITDVLESLGADSIVQSADRAFEVKVDTKANFFPNWHPKVRKAKSAKWAEFAVLVRKPQAVSNRTLSEVRVAKLILNSRIPGNALAGVGGSEKFSSVVAGVIDLVSFDLRERVLTRLERLGAAELVKCLLELYGYSTSLENQSLMEKQVENLLIRYPEIANVKWSQLLRTLRDDDDFRVSVRFRMLEFLNDHISKNPKIDFPEDWALNILSQMDILWWEQLDRLNPFFTGEFLEKMQQWPASYQRLVFGYFFYFSEGVNLKNKSLKDPSNLVLLRGLMDTPISIKRFLDLLYRQKKSHEEIDREELLRLAKKVAVMNEANRVLHSLFQAEIIGSGDVLNPQRLAIELLGSVDGVDRSIDNRLRALEKSTIQEVALASNLALLMRGKNLASSRPIFDSLERGEYRVLIALVAIHKKRDLRSLRSEREGTISTQLVDLMNNNELRVARVLLNIVERAHLWGLDSQDINTFIEDLDLSGILEREKKLRAAKRS
ncbi:MAG: hypothetical protein IPJ71_18945 [Bdellovibrionales bacterium]|nr:hypothetical protein [Bdellovibrionales bacterium]